MLAWPVMAARRAEIFDRIIVSADSEEIAEVAVSFGAEVPFMRPPHLSDDHTLTAPVFLHALDALSEQDALGATTKKSPRLAAYTPPLPSFRQTICAGDLKHCKAALLLPFPSPLLPFPFCGLSDSAMMDLSILTGQSMQ